MILSHETTLGSFYPRHIFHLLHHASLLADPETGTKTQNEKLIDGSSNEAALAYKRADLPVDERVGDLIGRMTVEEKARQLDMYFGCEDLLDKNKDLTIDHHTHAKPDADFDPQFAEKNLGSLGVGSIHDLYPSAKLYNTIQAWVIQSSRLGIPALFLEEGLHGYMAYDQTVFPQSVNLATTWNPDLAKATGAAIAAETRADGVDMILGPVLDIARDPRWGRVEEDFGEDPFLSGRLGLAYVHGMQGDSLATDHNVIAEPKHFAAHGSPEGGLNTSPVHAGEREVRSIMLKSFEPAVREGNAMGIMAAYPPQTLTADSLHGKSVADETKVLHRDEWGLQRICACPTLAQSAGLYDTHHVAASSREAVQLALNSGVDMQFYDFPHDTFQNAIIDGVKNGQVSEATLDAAVSRILRVKFLLGLFDHPFIDENLDKSVRRSQDHLDLSLEVARQSMCLLKNQNNLLPLKKDLKRIAVIGPNANIARLGDYADVATEGPEFGMLEPDQAKICFAARRKLLYCRAVKKLTPQLSLAKKRIMRFWRSVKKNGISGEGHDRSELDLPGNQEALLEAVQQTGVPVILVLQNGRALTIPWAAVHVPAILEAWYPGEFGGRAIAGNCFGRQQSGGTFASHLISKTHRATAACVLQPFSIQSKNGYVDGDDLHRAIRFWLRVELHNFQIRSSDRYASNCGKR